jgi:hypothetical protein
MVTAGYGSFSCLVGKLLTDFQKSQYRILRAVVRIRKYSSIGPTTNSTCATAARTSDGSSVLVYLPTISTITLDMSKLSSLATARWYDPTNGEYAVHDHSDRYGHAGRYRLAIDASNPKGFGILIFGAAGVRKLLGRRANVDPDACRPPGQDRHALAELSHRVANGLRCPKFLQLRAASNASVTFGRRPINMDNTSASRA